jgi:hypothetical protein
VTRWRFVCEHKSARMPNLSRTITRDELWRLCAAVLAGPGPAEVLI